MKSPIPSLTGHFAFGSGWQSYGHIKVLFYYLYQIMAFQITFNLSVYKQDFLLLTS
jgi:hypothetical protein